MKSLSKALLEYRETSGELKPKLCRNENFEYCVINLFSKKFIESRNFKILKG